MSPAMSPVDWKAEAERLDRSVDEWIVKAATAAAETVRLRKVLAGFTVCDVCNSVYLGTGWCHDQRTAQIAALTQPDDPYAETRRLRREFEDFAAADLTKPKP